MNSASARILARVVGAFAVISAVFFLISGEASLLPLARPLSQMPIAFQSWKPLFRPVALPNKETTMNPATLCHGGIPASGLMAFTSFTTHCHWPPPPEGANSAWFSQARSEEHTSELQS